MDIVNNTYLKEVKPDPKDRIEVEVGDIKQPDFYPQLKVKRWDNEVNASFRLVNSEATPAIETEGEKIKWRGKKMEAHFYEIPAGDKTPVTYQNLRYLEINDVTAVEQSALWELPQRVIPNTPTLMAIKAKDQIFTIGSLTPLAEFHHIDKILCEKSRIFNPTTGTGGLLMEASSLYFFLVVPAKDKKTAGLLIRQSVSEVCQELGIETKLERNDIYFKLGDKWKKFSGHLIQYWGDWMICVTTISFDFDAVAAVEIYDLSSPKFTNKDVFENISDIVGGLKEVLPTIDPVAFKQSVATKIAQKLSLTLQPDALTSEENTAIADSLPLLSSEDWVVNGIRNDFNDLIPAVKTNEEGATELEIILKEKPATNVIEFTLETKGLKFLYQPPLNQAQIDKGDRRPVNVVGSYAVYCSEQKINWKGKKVYKAGKVGHIFRPKIEDADGNWVWGELNVDEQAGILSVTIPQDFLDNAVYPIRHAAGLTFGYTSQGGTAGSSIAQEGSDNSIRVGCAVTGAVGTLDSLHACLQGNMGVSDYTLDLAMHLCEEDTAGNSHDQVAEVERLNVDTTTKQFYVFTAGSEALIIDQYVISVLGDGADLSDKSSYISLFKDTGGASTNKYYEGVGNGYATLRDEDPWTEAEAADTDIYSLYATYSVAAGPADITSINGIAIANVASVNGIAKASIETINGIS